MTRQGWILQGDEVHVVRQCALVEVSRATFYAALCLSESTKSTCYFAV